MSVICRITCLQTSSRFPSYKKISHSKLFSYAVFSPAAVIFFASVFSISIKQDLPPRFYISISASDKLYFCRKQVQKGQLPSINCLDVAVHAPAPSLFASTPVIFYFLKYMQFILQKQYKSQFPYPHPNVCPIQKDRSFSGSLLSASSGSTALPNFPISS